MKKLAISFLLVAAGCYGGETSKKKTSLDLKNVSINSSVQVIVQWQGAVGETTTQKIAALGGTVISELKSIGSGVYSVPVSAIDTLAADPDVKFISKDRTVRKRSAAVAVTPATINAPYAWNLDTTVTEWE